MTPVDDELRRTLSARAEALTPSADPLAGITTRARGIRRRRAAVSVLGSALAVAVAVAVVPTLLTGPSKGQLAGPAAPSATPSSATPSSSPPPVIVTTPPSNLLDWDARGDNATSGSTPATAVEPSPEEVSRAFAQTHGDPPGRNAHYRALFTTRLQTGYSFTVGQAWIDGDLEATTVSYSSTESGPRMLKEYGPTSSEPVAVLALLDDVPAADSPLLVVIPVPGTGQVSYSAKSSGKFSPAPENGYDFVALLPRAVDATDDRLEILDGDGDLDNPTYRGPVAALLGSSAGR